MTHLSDEQLSGVLDDALAPREREVCDAHLAACEACRGRLAELSALDASLGSALSHDPGDAYFADFASRVSQRIAAEAAPARKPGFWDWLRSPRGLTLAGSMAALLVVAGIAWQRFGGSSQSAGALLESAPSQVGSTAAPEPMAMSTPAPESAATSRAADSAPPPVARRAAEPERARVQQAPPQRLESPVASSEAASEKTRVDATNAPNAEAKPAPEARTPAAAPPPVAANSEREGSARKSLLGSVRSLLRDAAPKPAATPTPAPAAPQALTATAPSEPAAALSSGAAADAQEAGAPHCGVVRDTNGRPIAGATISVSGARTFTTRTADDGSYCLDDAHAGDTLSVMRVGYDTLRLPLGERTPLAVALRPQPALGGSGGLALGGSGSAKLRGDGLASRVQSFMAPPADVYAALPEPVRAQVSAAREASALAARERSAAAHERAALAWDGVLTATSGAASYDARFRALSERRAALQAEPTAEREQRYRRDLEAYLAAVPANQPERRTVEQWRTGWDRVKAGYR